MEVAEFETRLFDHAQRRVILHAHQLGVVRVECDVERKLLGCTKKKKNMSSPVFSLRAEFRSQLHFFFNNLGVDAARSSPRTLNNINENEKLPKKVAMFALMVELQGPRTHKLG